MMENIQCYLRLAIGLFAGNFLPFYRSSIERYLAWMTNLLVDPCIILNEPLENFEKFRTPKNTADLDSMLYIRVKIVKFEQHLAITV